MTIKLPLRLVGWYFVNPLGDKVALCHQGLQSFVGPITEEQILLCASNDKAAGGVGHTFGIEWCAHCGVHHFTYDNGRLVPPECDSYLTKLTDATNLVNEGVVTIYLWIEPIQTIDSYEPTQIP